MAQVPAEIKDKVEPQSPQQEDIITIEFDDDQLEIFSWAQGRKKQKMIEIPNKFRGKALQILPMGSKFLDTIRYNFLLKQASENEKIPNKNKF